MTTPDEKTLATLTKLFEEEFGPIGDRQVLYVHAPGRSEISGNHTDHEGGHVIAGSLDVAVDGIAVATDSNKVRVADEGYPTFEIALDTLDIQESEKGTSASLVRGMAHEIAALGVEPQGFDFAFTCSVPSGGGLSSSAAVEAAYGRAMETLWGAPAIEPVALAQMSQRTENNYYGKPCGLMDQMACAAGGPILLDFSDKENISCEKIAFSFEDMGCRLVIVNTGKGHADLSEEYSSIPMEMREAAKAMGVELLCESSMENLLAHVKDIPNDRAVLRAMHFYEENRRVADAVKAVENKDGEGFLRLLEESGNSSWEWLQNCYSLQNCKEQKITLSLALTKLFLNKIGAGICRVHGGGFAGVIMCVLPIENADAYVDYMAQYVGRENVYPMNIRSTGAVHVE